MNLAVRLSPGNLEHTKAEELLVYSFTVISDDLRHSKVSVWVFMQSLLIELKKTATHVDHLFVFSDNCAEQIHMLKRVLFKMDIYVNIECNFFAAGHGKGAIDRVGGSVKRTAWKAARRRQAEHFYCVSAEKCKDFHVLFVLQADVDLYAQLLNKRWSSIREA
ncbi:hypothetical protein PR048_008382, partial [Dryococelus australis]